MFGRVFLMVAAILFSALTIAATLYFLYLILGALVPFLIAGIIALLLNPFVERLCQRGFSRPRAVFNVFLGFVLLLLTISIALLPSFYQQAQNIIDFFSSPKNANITRTVNSWVERTQSYLEREIQQRQPWIQRNRDALKRLGIPTTPEEVDQVAAHWRTRLQNLLTDWATKVFNAIVQTLLGVLSRVIWVILIPLSVYFFLLDMPRVRQAFLYLLPPTQRAPASDLLNEIGTVFFNYIRGLVTAALTYGLTCMVFFWVLGAPNPVLLGVLAGLLYPIPYVGAFLIMLTSGGFTLLFEPSPLLFYFTPPKVWHAVIVVLAGIGLNMLFDMLITPRLLGGAVGLRPLAALIAIVVGATVGGIWGMMLAVPVTASLLIIVRQVLHYFYGESKGESPAPPAEEPTDAQEVVAHRQTS
ncbi:MAG: AI-2E family transporter [Armatimonadota bacterium]